jgi:hypothetical protein
MGGGAIHGMACSVLYSTILHALHCTVLYCTVLYLGAVQGALRLHNLKGDVGELEEWVDLGRANLGRLAFAPVRVHKDHELLGPARVPRDDALDCRYPPGQGKARVSVSHVS